MSIVAASDDCPSKRGPNVGKNYSFTEQWNNLKFISLDRLFASFIVNFRGHHFSIIFFAWKVCLLVCHLPAFDVGFATRVPMQYRRPLSETSTLTIGDTTKNSDYRVIFRRYPFKWIEIHKNSNPRPFIDHCFTSNCILVEMIRYRSFVEPSLIAKK